MTRTAAKETAAAAAPSDAAVATSASDGEINDGTMRLAEELRPYVPQNTLPEDANPADLQLTICRKLREVRQISSGSGSSSSTVMRFPSSFVIVFRNYSLAPGRRPLICGGPLIRALERSLSDKVVPNI